VSQGALIKQIQFPKLVLPVAATTAAVVGFVFGLIPLSGIMLLYPHRISAFVLFLPIVAVVQYTFSLGVSFIVAGVNVFFRDLGNVLRHALRLWFYLSPGLYSLSVLDASATFQANPVLRTLAHLNPFAILFEAYRAIIYGKPDAPPHAPDLSSLLNLLIASLVLVAIGTILFKRLEPSYAKVL
jgi:ABC-type polysaccharide/polyol phosphate export permease